jgi:uncharacterized membrane protein SpoIIM required for sporulation/uncharacterized RDD family membrane protein YckC
MMQQTPDVLANSVTGVELSLPVAGPGARSFAFLVDWHIRALLAIAWFVVAAVTYNGSWSLAQPFNPDALWFALVLTPPAAIYCLYHPVLEVAMRGRTPGKRIAGIHIVARDGGSPGIGALLTRNVFRIVDSFPLFYPVGLITTMITQDQVRVGDIAAGTVLVYDPTRITAGSVAAPRGVLWQSAAARAARLSATRANTDADAAQLADDYRMLAHDLARARQRMPGSRAHEFLEAAYAQAHATLYKPRWSLGRGLQALFRNDIPQAVHELRSHIAWSTAVFVLTVASGYALVRLHPGLIALFSSPELIASVEKGQLWTEGMLNVVPSSILSLQILTNNIVVSLVAYCAGFVFGLGTVYILGLNGMMLGAVFAFTGLHGLDGSLFRFVVAHGLVEISVMCVSGAAGAAVGEALIRPKHGSRAESFRIAARQSGRLLFACAVLLVGSGIIEGYVSPDPDVPLWAHVAIGVAYWIVMIAVLRGWFFGRWRAEPPPQTPSHSPRPPQSLVLRDH